MVVLRLGLGLELGGRSLAGGLWDPSHIGAIFIVSEAPP